jgi:hypothetical protein
LPPPDETQAYKPPFFRVPHPLVIALFTNMA